MPCKWRHGWFFQPNYVNWQYKTSKVSVITKLSWAEPLVVSAACLSVILEASNNHCCVSLHWVRIINTPSRTDHDSIIYISDFRPAIPRRRQLSSSSDSSITRVATQQRLTTAVTDVIVAGVQQASPSQRFDLENPSTSGVPVQTVWSEVFNCYEALDPHRRPRTWHHVPNLLNQSHSPHGLVMSTDLQLPRSQPFTSIGMSHLMAPEITRRITRRLTPSPLGYQRPMPEKFNSLQYSSGTWSNYNSLHLQGSNSATGVERPIAFAPEAEYKSKPIPGPHGKGSLYK